MAVPKVTYEQAVDVMVTEALHPIIHALRTGGLMYSTTVFPVLEAAGCLMLERCRVLREVRWKAMLEVLRHVHTDDLTIPQKQLLAPVMDRVVHLARRFGREDDLPSDVYSWWLSPTRVGART